MLLHVRHIDIALHLGLVPGKLDMIDNNHDKGLAGSPALLPKEL